MRQLGLLCQLLLSCLLSEEKTCFLPLWQRSLSLENKSNHLIGLLYPWVAELIQTTLFWVYYQVCGLLRPKVLPWDTSCNFQGWRHTSDTLSHKHLLEGPSFRWQIIRKEISCCRVKGGVGFSDIISHVPHCVWTVQSSKRIWLQLIKIVCKHTTSFHSDKSPTPSKSSQSLESAPA